MTAMLLREPGPAEGRPLERVDLPVPEPGPGEIRLSVRACGVCHADLHTVEGDLALLRWSSLLRSIDGLPVAIEPADLTSHVHAAFSA